MGFLAAICGFFFFKEVPELALGLFSGKEKVLKKKKELISLKTVSLVN